MHKKEKVRTIREGIREQEKVGNKLAKIYKTIRKMKLGKFYTTTTYKTDKRSNVEIKTGELIYKDKDIITLRIGKYCESFRVLDLYDGTLEIKEGKYNGQV